MNEWNNWREAVKFLYMRINVPHDKKERYGSAISYLVEQIIEHERRNK